MDSFDVANSFEKLSDSSRNGFARLKKILGIEKRPEVLLLGKHHNWPIFAGDLKYDSPEAKLYDAALEVIKPIVETGKISSPLTVEQGRAIIFAEELLSVTGCDKDAKAVGWILDQALKGPTGKAIAELVYANGGRPDSVMRQPDALDVAIERSFGSSFGETQVTQVARTKNTVIAKARMSA